MKQHQTDKNLLYKTMPVLAVMISGLTVMPAFATLVTSTGPFSPNQEIPSYSASQCNYNSQSCASASGSGADALVARSSTSFWGEATANNNEDTSSSTVGSSPQLTSSASVVKGTVIINSQGHWSVPNPGQYVDYQYGVNIWKHSGSSWSKVAACYYTTTETGAGSGTDYFPNNAETCAYSNSGTNTYAVAGGHQDEAPGYSSQIYGTNIFDFWSGTNYASTYELELCDGC